MKTYSKSKARNFDTCRCCLDITDNGIHMYAPVFNFIPIVINMCLNSSVFEGDGLPSKICEECFKVIKSIDIFRSKCKVADQWLRSKLEESTKRTSRDNNGLKESFNLFTELDNGGTAAFNSSQKATETQQDNIVTEWEECKEREVIEECSINESPSQLIVSAMQVTADPDPHNAITAPDVVHLGSNFEVLVDVALAGESFQVVAGDEKPSNSQSLPVNKPVSKNKETNATCPQCQKQFATYHSMLRHQTTHTGDKLFMCAECGLKCSQSASLRRHALIHKNVKPFKCEFCDRGFTQKSNLKAHMRTHLENNAFRFECKHCSRTFKFSSGLTRHKLVHKGVVYQCNVCKKILFDASSLKRHMKRHP